MNHVIENNSLKNILQINDNFVFHFILKTFLKFVFNNPCRLCLLTVSTPVF